MNYTEERSAFTCRMDDEICRQAWHDPLPGQILRTLCEEIGPRPAGGVGMRQARVLLADELTKISAAAIHEEPVPVRSWQPGATRLELQSSPPVSFACGQYLFSAPIDATLPLVDIGNGNPEDIERLSASIPGAAVLMAGHAVSGRKYVAIRQRIEWVRRAGAAAIITRSSPHTGLPALDVADLTGHTQIPCFSVSRESGEALAAAAATGTAQVYLYADGSSAPAECANLIADLGPDQLPGETILLGAHLDSYWNAPGASDNLTGIVTMLEVARLLAPFRQSFQRTFRLVAFTAEEIGCLGSRAYAERHGDDLQQTTLMMNMDTLFPATTRGMAVMWSPEMRDYIAGAFADADRQVDVRNLFCTSSDYFPFMLAGIPAARPADWENSLPIWWHSEIDDLAHIRTDWIQHNAMIYAQLLGRLLTDPQPLPARRLSHDEVRARLEQEDIGEWMLAQGYNWPL